MTRIDFRPCLVLGPWDEPEDDPPDPPADTLITVGEVLAGLAPSPPTSENDA
jgi:hypothetical protein